MAKEKKPTVVDDSESEQSPLPELDNKKNKGNAKQTAAQKSKPIKKPAAQKEESDDQTPAAQKKKQVKAPRKASNASHNQQSSVPAKSNVRKGSTDKVQPKKVTKAKQSSSQESSEEVQQPKKGTKQPKVAQKAPAAVKKAGKAKQSSSQSEDEIIAPKKQTVTATKDKKQAKQGKLAAKAKQSSSQQSEQEKKPIAKKVPAKVTKPKDQSEQSSEEQKPKARKGSKQIKAQPKKIVKPAQSEQSQEEKPKARKGSKEVKVQPKKVVQKEESEQESESQQKPKPRKGSKQIVKGKAVAKKIQKKDQSDQEQEEEPQPAKKKAVAGKGKVIQKEESEQQQKPAPSKRKASGQSLNKKAAKVQQPEDQSGEYEVAVQGLSFNAFDGDVRDLFSACGNIINVKMINRPDGKPKGFAFVKFSSKNSFNKALELNGTDHMGRSIRVEQARGTANGGRPQRDGGNRNQGGQVGTAVIETPTLYIGGLSYNSTVDSIKQFFASAGEVQSARIVSDKETQKPRGFGYVEFYDVETAKKAYETLNGQYLDGRAIRLDAATQRDRTNNQGGGGFGFNSRQGGNRGGPRENSAVNLSQDDKNAKKGAISGYAGKKIML